MSPGNGWYDRIDISEAVAKLAHTETEWTEEIKQIELQRLENEVQLRDHIATIDRLIHALQEQKKKADSQLARLKKSSRSLHSLSPVELSPNEI